MYHIFCIHSSVEGHLGSFQLLAIINKAAMNILEHKEETKPETQEAVETGKQTKGRENLSMKL